MSLAQRLFDAITQFPAWLESFDSLNIPAWAVLLSMAIAVVGFIFAVREFLSWFLKTNSIVDEVIRLETLVRDLQGDLTALEATVARLQSTAAPTNDEADAVKTSASAAPSFSAAVAAPAAPRKPQFRLDN